MATLLVACVPALRPAIRSAEPARLEKALRLYQRNDPHFNSLPLSYTLHPHVPFSLHCILFHFQSSTHFSSTHSTSSTHIPHITPGDRKMGHVSSSPVHGEVTTVSKKQFIRLLSPDALSAQRRKLMKRPSGRHFEGVTVCTTTTRDLGKEQSGAGPSSGAHEPTVSSTPMDVCADVLSDQATSTHEMVLKDVSTNELLRLLGEFLCRRCRLLKDLSPEDPLMWLRMVDVFLLVTKCQRQCFIVPGSVVFLYMLCRDTVSAEVSSMRELQAVVLTCFYVSYAYIGHELGYPVMPFIVEDSSYIFWKRTLDITKRMSGKMLQINEDPQFFSDVFTALKNGTDH